MMFGYLFLSSSIRYPMARGEGLPPMQPLIHFGYVVKMGPRIVNGSVDIYKTGSPRIRFFYPSLGVYKYSSRSDHAGDILHGRPSLLFGGRRWFPPKDAKLAAVRFVERPVCWTRACDEKAVLLPGSPHPLMLPVCRWTRGRDANVTGLRVGDARLRTRHARV
jgi:hypothetical protein